MALWHWSHWQYVLGRRLMGHSPGIELGTANSLLAYNHCTPFICYSVIHSRPGVVSTGPECIGCAGFVTYSVPD